MRQAEGFQAANLRVGKCQSVQRAADLSERVVIYEVQRGPGLVVFYQDCDAVPERADQLDLRVVGVRGDEVVPGVNDREAGLTDKGIDRVMGRDVNPDDMLRSGPNDQRQNE